MARGETWGRSGELPMGAGATRRRFPRPDASETLLKYGMASMRRVRRVFRRSFTETSGGGGAAASVNTKNNMK